MDTVELLKSFGQARIIAYIKKLPFEQRAAFLKEAKVRDIELIFKLYSEFARKKKEEKHSYDVYKDRIFTRPRTHRQNELEQVARQAGEALISDNRVAVLIVAAGQGSRLGWDGPKGTFPISPVKQKTLFQIQCEKVRAIEEKFKAAVPLFLMINPQDEEVVRGFFEKNSYFGLNRSKVHMFAQGMLPSITPQGELLLKDGSSLLINPDGHGGALKAMRSRGIIEMLASSGISEIFYTQIDNPLVKIADPAFLGYHKLEGSQVSTKVVRRRSCEEKVGVFMSENGRSKVVEYSDMGPDDKCVFDKKEMRDWAGNTGTHIFSVDFLDKLMKGDFDLSFHRAVKKVQAFDPGSGHKKETEAWKFEKFIFDVIPFAGKTCCVELDRAEEFAPLKNKEGDDSPETVKPAMSSLHKAWLKEAGIETGGCEAVEVSPLYALDRQDAARKAKKEKGRRPGCYFGP